MEITPGKLLQLHGIEVSPDEPRTTEQIVRDYIEKGIISVVLDSALEVPKSDI